SVNPIVPATITDTTLNGSYTLPLFGAQTETGSNVCFVPDASQNASVPGRWTGTMTADPNSTTFGLGGTLDITLVQNQNDVREDDNTDGTMTTPEESVNISRGTGVHGCVIDNRFLFHISFNTPNHIGGQSSDQVQHRYFYGTVNGATMSGTY